MVQLEQISRQELSEKILLDLKKIQPYCSQPLAAVYADNIIKKLRTMRDKFPFEPLREILVAFHDAIATQNRWLDYQPHQYQDVYELVKNIRKSEQIDRSQVEEAILALENFGFETLPFELTSDRSSLFNC